ncbi:MAG: phosphate signaling complex protein PhoU [Selenomonadaceae bacterium]
MVDKTTRQEYIKSLAEVQEKVIEMGIAAREAVESAMKAFIQQNKNMAARVMKEDDRIDDMTIDIEDLCILLIAKQQPIAHDLRVIATGFKISTDLERIGDHAFDIAKIAYDINKEAPMKNLDFFYTSQLGACAIEMLNIAIEAYKKEDITLAEKVCVKDDEMDELFAKTFFELSSLVTNEVARAQQITELLFIARFLERIGDHATNIAEWVIYLETAERIRKTRE